MLCNKKFLASFAPHAAKIPTESDFNPISSVGSSHGRLTSAEDNEEASLLGYPPIGLVDKRNIDQSEGKRNMALYPRPEVRGFTARVVKPNSENKECYKRKRRESGHRLNRFCYKYK